MTRVEDIPDDVNGDVLRRMYGNGDSLTVARDINFSVIFSDEASAIAFCKATETNGSRVRYKFIEDGEEYPWDVTASREMVPVHQDIDATEDYLASVAMPLGGQNDGWGCFDVEDMPPR
jgi:hypothetical protein